MYRKQEQLPLPAKNFELPFEGQLSENNRWVIMAQLIPWSDFESEYASLFSEKMGAPAKTFRMALASLIIKEKLGTSDRETVEQNRFKLIKSSKNSDRKNNGQTRQTSKK